ncbi:hypothetical protein [Clostridium hydrogenum]|nr:hypothetical protein [Clostridium hydrogenum]
MMMNNEENENKVLSEENLEMVTFDDLSEMEEVVSGFSAGSQYCC